jgi:hypothetical protein
VVRRPGGNEVWGQSEPQTILSPKIIAALRMIGSSSRYGSTAPIRMRQEKARLTSGFTPLEAPTKAAPKGGQWEEFWGLCEPLPRAPGPGHANWAQQPGLVSRFGWSQPWEAGAPDLDLAQE